MNKESNIGKSPVEGLYEILQQLVEIERYNKEFYKRPELFKKERGDNGRISERKS